LTTAAPTVVALETDSAWVLIFAVSLVTFLGALLVRRLIRRPGGAASALLLGLPLILPLIATPFYEHAVLPQVSVLKPVGSTLFEKSGTLLHLLMLSDSRSRVHPYAISGSAEPWLLAVGLGFSAFMVVRRLLGVALVHRLVRLSRKASHLRGQDPGQLVARLCRSAGLKRCPEIMVLPPGVSGAFVVGGYLNSKILISADLIECLDDDELEAILAHEIAHLAARDVHLAFGAGMLRDLVAWNPVAHLAYRHLVTDRELEADRLAAQITGHPLAVASGLLKMLELMRRRPARRRRLALALLSPGSPVSHRVKNLLALADGRTAPKSSGWMPYLAAACLVVALGLQAASKVAAHNDGALAIVVGAPPTTHETLWLPPHGRVGHTVVDQAHKAGPARASKRYPELATNIAFREQDLPKWIDAVMTRIERSGASPEMLTQIREDWQAVPLLQVRPATGWMGIYRIQHASL
jgi:Zn-dependent protease with chaperone function